MFWNFGLYGCRYFSIFQDLSRIRTLKRAYLNCPKNISQGIAEDLNLLKSELRNVLARAGFSQNSDKNRFKFNRSIKYLCHWTHLMRRFFVSWRRERFAIEGAFRDNPHNRVRTFHCDSPSYSAWIARVPEKAENRHKTSGKAKICLFPNSPRVSCMLSALLNWASGNNYPKVPEASINLQIWERPLLQACQETVPPSDLSSNNKTRIKSIKVRISGQPRAREWMNEEECRVVDEVKWSSLVDWEWGKVY